MNKLTLCPGTFTYHKEDDGLKLTLPVMHILLDGKDFIKQIRDWTHDKYLSPLEPKILYDMLHDEWKHHSKVFIGGCECGQPMCDPLYVHIEENKYKMIWSNISTLEDGVNGRTILFRMNPIIFDKDAYFAELTKMKAWLIKEHYIDE